MSFSASRILILCALCSLMASSASADLVSFSEGDSFDGDQATLLFDSSDLAGPLGAGGVILRTVKINGVEASTAANNLETTGAVGGGKLGIDSASVSGGEKNNWDDGESWTYELDQVTYFDAISFGGFSSGEVFTVQSNSFIGFSPVGTLGTGVSFNSTLGAWMFDGAASNDDFTVSDLGGTAARVLALDDITISFAGSSSATLQAISISVPEPGCFGFLLVLGMGVTLRRKQRS